MSDAAVRWTPEGYEFRCESCRARKRQCFWPLTDEFWSPARGMKRCLACQREDAAARARARYRSEPAYREMMKRRARDYESECPRTVKRRLRDEAMRADPLLLAKHRLSAAQRQREYRARQRAA